MNAPQIISATGLRYGLPNDDYHAGEGISKSHLDAIARSPAHYFAKYLDENRQPNNPTPAMLAGTLAHCAILEPEAFHERYVMAPEGIDRRTKAGKEAWEAFQAIAEGREVITQEQFVRAFAQRDSVMRLPDVAALFENSASEVSAYWNDDVTGELCKCRPDLVHTCADGGVILVDVKTTTDASLREFSRSIAKWRYHVQAAWYIDGYQKAADVQVHGFMFVAVESEAPHAACAYMLDDASLDLGREIYRRDLNKLAGCRQYNEWPGYSNEIEVISLPAWYIKQEQ